MNDVTTRLGFNPDLPLDHLDNGPFIRKPRKMPKPKSPEELRVIRAKAWATRRAESARNAGSEK